MSQRTDAAPATRAGVREYNDFFGLYAEIVSSSRRVCLTDGLAGRQNGLYFLSLGFIPGPAALLFFKDGNVQIWDTTPDVKKGVSVPTGLGAIEALPDKVREALEEWAGLVKGLGYEPSPWNLSFARGVLEGNPPSRYLAMMMPRFRYRHGDSEVPFGIVLCPTRDEDGMEVVAVYNPAKPPIPDVPEKGAILTFDGLKDDEGPVQKLLRTWALMESNYASRYYRDGNPRQPRR